MTRMIPWCEDEAILLFDTYEQVQKAPELKSSLIKALSIQLRRRAVDNGLKIDDVYRNITGISMRMLEFDKIIKPEGKGLSNTSKLFRDTSNLYVHHRSFFLKKLEPLESYRVKVLADLVGFTEAEAVVLLDGYLNLRNPGESKAHMARLISMKLRALAINSGYVIHESYRTPGGLSGRLRKMEIAFTGNNPYGEAVPQVFRDAVCMYRKDRSRYLEVLTWANESIGEVVLPEDAVKIELAKEIKPGKPEHISGNIIMTAQAVNERAFFSWLKGQVPQKQYKDIQNNKACISNMLMQHKVIKKDLFLIDDIKTINGLFIAAPKCFADIKLRDLALQMIKWYSLYLDIIKTQNTETGADVNNLVTDIENVVKNSPDGILKTELNDRFSRYSDRQINAAIQEADIILVLDKYFHKNNIEDFEFMADTLLDVLLRQFKVFGDYTSDVQLYKEARPKLDDFFFYNGAFDSRLEVFELAAYLFNKNNYKGYSFVFRDKRHIWKSLPDYPMDFGGLLIKYAREHGNIFSRDEAINFLEFHGSGTPAQTLSLILNRSGRDCFIQYAENRFVTAEALNIGKVFLEQLRLQIETLLEGEDYVALGDVSDYFYSLLPALPAGVTWGPLLLEAVLERFDIGFITIDAGDTNDMKTIDAALVRKNSAFKTFGDVVWNELNSDFQLPRTMTNEEFRLYLLRKGFIHGMEKTYTVHKTVANDLRFYWTDGNGKVTISKS